MQKLQKLKHIFVVTLLSIGAVFSVIFLFSADFQNPLNAFFIYRTGWNVWQDIIYKHNLKPSKDIVIVKIDGKSIDALQARWDLKMLGIPKRKYTELVKRLREYGVKGIGFDIIFQNEDSDENEFVQELKKKNDVVVAAQYVDICRLQYEKIRLSNKELYSSFPPADSFVMTGSKCSLEFIKILGFSQANGYVWANSKAILKSTGSVQNQQLIKLYCESGKAGYTNCPGLPRSIYKEVPWGIVNINSWYSRWVFQDISNEPYLDWKRPWSGASLTTRDTKLLTLPLALHELDSTSKVSYFYQRKSAQIHPFFWPAGSYISFSLIEILNDTENSLAKNFKNKYVFIWESGTEIHDSVTSPVDGKSMDGVELHAHYLDGILQNRMLEKLTSEQYILGLLWVTLILVLLYFSLPSYLALLLALVMPIVVIYGSRYSYDTLRVLIDIFPVLMATWVTTFPIVYIYKFFVVDREKRQLKNNFAHYIDPRVVEDIALKWVSIELGGEKRKLTVFFSDIAGFTTISEKLDPRDLFYLMTAYLSQMTDILIREWWTLDKYIGDAVMGFFGAPLSYEDDAVRAANTALAMRKVLPDFNADIQKRGIDPIDFRVGIATGEVMVGNIWSHNRFNYTVLWDTVNLASRLEWTGKEYNVQIIISHATKLALSQLYFTRELDTIAVKWKSEWIRIHELVGYSVDYVDRTIYTLYERALGLYRAGDYREAGKLWQTQAAIDPPSRVMMLRCVELLKWTVKVQNGTFIMNHK